MLIKGQRPSLPNEVLCVIPRGDSEEDYIVFKARAVLKIEEFEELCPTPKPPMIRKPGNEKAYDYDNISYKNKVESHNRRRMGWIVINSLKATEDLKWETISDGDPTTWTNWDKELTDAQFSSIEKNLILQAVLDANCLNEDKLETARRNFIAAQLRPAKSSGDEVEPTNTPSGELVSAMA